MNNLRQKLSQWRSYKLPGENKEDEYVRYDPVEAYEIGQQVLSSSSLPVQERYAILEQVFMAALDIGNLESAKQLFTEISKKFPVDTSVRVQKLQGMMLEAQDKWDEALLIYNKILKSDESNISIRKRIIAVYVSKGDRQTAIKELVQHVDTFMQDIEAWTQLAELYVQENMFQQAAFCFEELMLLRPKYPLYYTRFADIVGQIGKYELAIKYYSAALEMIHDHPRSLYGLRVVTSNLIKASQLPSYKPTQGPEAIPIEIVKQLHSLSNERILALYELQYKDDKSKLSFIQNWIKKS